MAPQESPLPEARPTGRNPMDEQQFTADHQEDHPHACWGGYVFLGYTALDEETGEEVERSEVLPCRRCADSR